MRAFDNILLANTFLVEKAKSLKDAGFVTPEEFKSISTKLPTLKSQKNILVRIGFFLLGSFLFSSIMGTISLLFMPFLNTNYELLLFFYAIVGFVGCEFFARHDFYGYGLDDAFIIAAQASLIAAIGITSESVLGVFVAMTIIGLICCLRYVHALSALICCVGIAGFFSTLIIKNKVIDMAFLPFVMLLLAIGIYSIYTKLSQSSESYYYKRSLQLTQIFALVLGYASLNYLVVRQLSEELMGVHIGKNQDISFAFLFYGFTFIIPICYIVFSLFSKDRIMLIIGFLTLGFSFYTIRFYYSLMPVEVALILGGTVLSVITYFAIKQLKNKESGITFQSDKGNDGNLLLNAQALIINSQLDLKPIEVATQDMPFGGGGFSGGGSGGSF